IKLQASDDPGVLKVNGVITVHLAPDQIMAALSLEFADGLTTSAIEVKVEQLEECIRAAHPQVVALFIKPQRPSRFREVRWRRFGLSRREQPSSTLPVLRAYGFHASPHRIVNVHAE